MTGEDSSTGRLETVHVGGRQLSGGIGGGIVHNLDNVLDSGFTVIDIGFVGEGSSTERAGIRKFISIGGDSG